MMAQESPESWPEKSLNAATYVRTGLSQLSLEQ